MPWGVHGNFGSLDRAFEAQDGQVVCYLCCSVIMTAKLAARAVASSVGSLTFDDRPVIEKMRQTVGKAFVATNLNVFDDQQALSDAKDALRPLAVEEDHTIRLSIASNKRLSYVAGPIAVMSGVSV